MKRLIKLILISFIAITTFSVNVNANEKVAKINDTEYSTLAEAIANVKDKETILILDDLTLTNEIIIPDGKTFTIDLNEKTITTSAVSGFVIDGANLTVKNGFVVNNNSTGISESTMETRTKAFFLQRTGTGSLTLDGVNVQSTGYSVNVNNNNKGNGARKKTYHQKF